MDKKRKLAFEERAVWGTCPVCDAKNGEPCDSSVGIQLGTPIDKGAHFGRLANAPFKIDLNEAAKNYLEIIAPE